MRAVVIDINSKHMVLLKEDGTFEKVKKSSGTEIGDEISLSAPKVDWKNINRYIGIAASIMLVLLGGLQVNAYYTPYGYVNIDINPSIELGFNKYERIISTKGLNGDGVKVLQNTPSVKHSKLEDATRSIVETASKANYIKNGQDNNIMFSIYTPNREKDKTLNTKINRSVTQYLKSSGRKAELINEIVSKEDLDRAALQKISVGKLKLYEKAKSVDPSVTIDDIKNKPVRDIMKMIRTTKKEIKTNDTNHDDKKIKSSMDEKLSFDSQKIAVIDNLPVNVGVKPGDNALFNNGTDKAASSLERKKQRDLRKAERKLRRDSNKIVTQPDNNTNANEQNVDNNNQ